MRAMQELNYPKANILYRFIAKFIDLLIVGGLCELLPGIGFIGGLFYLLISDGFLQGRSPGKWLIGLQVLVPARQAGCSFRESIIRNLPLAGAYCLTVVPYLGWLAMGIILTVEGLLVIGNEQGMRIGDELAGTLVLENETLNVGIER